MKLWHSFKKELKLASKGFYFYVEFIMAFIMLVVLLFVIPTEIKTTNTEYIYLNVPEIHEKAIMNKSLEDDLDHKVEEVKLKIAKQEMNAVRLETDTKVVYFMESEEEMKVAADTKNKLGATITTRDNGDLYYIYYLQGYESERYKNALKLVHVDFNALENTVNEQKVVALNSEYQELNDRENALPPILVLNGSLMGFFVIAAYIFLDKQAGVIKAYAVTPSSIAQYLLSKIGVLTVSTILSTLIIVIPVMGTAVNYPLLIILLLSTSFFGSTLGLLLASFYDNIMQSFGVLYLLMMGLAIPSISYYIPSWQPAWVRLIPTYSMIQGYKEVMLKNVDVSYVLLTSLGFVIGGLVLFIISNWRYKRTLTV